MAGDRAAGGTASHSDRFSFRCVYSVPVHLCLTFTGWVAYVVSALLTAIGENRFMPALDNPCKVINGRTGYVRENNSFILGRIMRDLEIWMDNRIKEHMRRMLEQRWEISRHDGERPAQRGCGEAVRKPVRGGLCVSIYHAGQAQSGHPGHDWLYFLGFATALLQLGIAAIPCGLDGDWSILVVTAAGIILSFTTASLRQWPKEKWACRHNSTKTVILTKGNGSQHAIVIIGDNKGLDIEDLATGPSAMDVSIPFSVTKIALLILAFLWVALLVVAAGVKQHSWFLLAIGAIRTLEDIFVAGSPRHPAAFGMPLNFENVIGEAKVMNTLFAVEQAYPRVGRSMLDTFFPGKLRPKERERWGEFERLADAMDQSLADQDDSRPMHA